MDHALDSEVHGVADQGHEHPEGHQKVPVFPHAEQPLLQPLQATWGRCTGSWPRAGVGQGQLLPWRPAQAQGKESRGSVGPGPWGQVQGGSEGALRTRDEAGIVASEASGSGCLASGPLEGTVDVCTLPAAPLWILVEDCRSRQGWGGCAESSSSLWSLHRAQLRERKSLAGPLSFPDLRACPTGCTGVRQGSTYCAPSKATSMAIGLWGCFPRGRAQTFRPTGK